jgi:hypothetical protein
MLAVAGVVSEAARDLGLRPVVVGGLAAWAWTGAPEFATADVDLVAPTSPRLERVMADLGFERRGRFFVLSEAGLFVEFPASELPPGWRPRRLAGPSGLLVHVLAPEDVLIDRLNQFVHWDEPDRGLQALAMLRVVDELDDARLSTRADAEGLSTALSALRRLRNEDRAPSEAELRAVARAVRSGTV